MSTETRPEARILPCGKRFIVEQLKDPEENERMRCSLALAHPGRHKNADRSLEWQDGAERSIKAILAAHDATPAEVSR